MWLVAPLFSLVKYSSPSLASRPGGQWRWISSLCAETKLCPTGLTISLAHVFTPHHFPPLVKDFYVVSVSRVCLSVFCTFPPAQCPFQRNLSMKLMFVCFVWFCLHRDLKHNLISTIMPGAFQGLSELRKL